MLTKEYWIQKLGLSEHPEGGYFKEVYRSQELISKRCLPQRYTSYRPFSTSIYFLLTHERHSAFHRIKSDEIWHFYSGSPLSVYILHPTGKLFVKALGPDASDGQSFQFAIPRGCWFAAEVAERNGYTLCGCTVAPGFDFEDFELAEKEKLLQWYPNHRNLINRFCIK